MLFVKFAIGCFFFISFSNSLLAQKVHISTNLLEYANFGTINSEIGLCLSQHFSIYVQGKYNPFEYKFKSGTKQINNRQLSVACGCKYWLWHSFSGWFGLAEVSWTKYNMGGLFSQTTYEGEACGLTLGLGYALMLNRRFNIDFGAGAMVGYTDYLKYSCPSCGKIKGGGQKIFVAPDNIMVQLSYLF